MRRLAGVLTILSVACGAATAEKQFCDGAVPLLQESMGSEPEETMHAQMEELARIAAVLPEGEKARLRTVLDDLEQRVQSFEEGPSADGWDNARLIEYVGGLCEGNDLTFYMVTP